MLQLLSKQISLESVTEDSEWQ